MSADLVRTYLPHAPGLGLWLAPEIPARKLQGALGDYARGVAPEDVLALYDATVFGSGSHDKTGRHCLPDDPNGKLDIVKRAGYWLRDENGKPMTRFKHICWDGCMFPNEVMMKQQTWNDILAAMIEVRTNHGWVG